VTDYEVIAREVSGYQARFEAIEERLVEVEKVNARLEAAALNTARSMQEIARHWNAVYEAMRREEGRADLQQDLSEALGSEGYDFQPRESE
jgi:predicted nuclease with TOPRIM domain